MRARAPGVCVCRFLLLSRLFFRFFVFVADLQILQIFWLSESDLPWFGDQRQQPWAGYWYGSRAASDFGYIARCPRVSDPPPPVLSLCSQLPKWKNILT